MNFSSMANHDAVDESKLILCCALCCANVSIYPTCDCFGCSGKAGICCMNVECCAKMGPPCLFPCCCVGLRPECDGCSFINAQCHCCCAVASAAVPCNDEVPVALSVAGLTVFPKFGCCIRQSEIMNRG